MAKTWAQLWKDVKPATLLSEPLTAAMKQLDVDDKAFLASHSREDLARLSGATKTARRAIDATLAKCNPRLHKQGMKELAILGDQLDQSLKLIQKWQREVVSTTEEVNRRKQKIIEFLNAAGSRPNSQVASRGAQYAKEFNTWINSLHLYASEEMRSTLKYTTLSESLLQSLTKAIESDKDTGALQAEATELAKKVTAPLKFLSPGTLPGMQDGRPFGSG